MRTVDERSLNQKKHESRNPVQRALIRAFHDKAIELINRAGPKTILELGCGEGFVLSALAEAGIDAELTGVELSERADRIARELIEDGRQFDMVMMLEVLEHIPNPAQMLPILDRLSSGWLLLSVPWEPVFMASNFMAGKNIRRFGNDPDHVNHWGRRGFHKFISTHFDIIEMPIVFPWTMALARTR
jgi:2-polyprenyl-3-methyl-5-hydroxy-6-metoxy-1,4-benzoquinol methylase